MPKILVIGGTGMLGRPVAFQLLNDGFNVRVFTTNAASARTIFGDRVEYAEGDVTELEEIIPAMDGCDAVYVNLKGGPLPVDYVRIEDLGSKNVYEAAIETGVERIVQISQANVDDRHLKHVFIRAKYEAEMALMESGLTYTILKPTWFFESLPLFIKDNRAVFVGSGKQSFYFLSAIDFAGIASKCFRTDKAENKVFTIFGPEPMPIPEAMRRFLSIVHPDITLDILPIWLARLSSLLTFNKSLKSAVAMMAFYDKNDDSDIALGPEEADELFGRCSTTVELWSKAYRKVLKGV